MNLSRIRFNQWLAACFATFGAFGVSISLTWSATALPSLEVTGQVGTLTTSDKSWIGSLVNVGGFLACPLVGIKLINILGRKGSLLLLSFVAIPGWCLIMWATSPLHIIFGRFLCGISAGGCSVTIPVYIREISSKRNRGVLGSLYFLSMCLGKLFSNTIGIIYQANIATAICCLQPVIFIILLCVIPESPTFLLKKNLRNDAIAALSWLQKKGAPWPFPCSKNVALESESSPEYAHMMALAELIQQEQVDKSNTSVSLNTILSSGEILKPCLTTFILLCSAQLCGISVLSSYTVEIFQLIGDKFLKPQVATVGLATIQTLGCLPASFFVDKYGRKSLYLSSFAAMTFSMAYISAFFYVQQFQPALLIQYHQLTYVPFAALVVFYLSYSWGLGNLVFVTLSELLPPEIIGPASAAASMFYWASAFIVTQTFQMFSDSVPTFVWYAFYGSVCLVGGLYTLVFLPETKGLNFEEIQKLYKSKIVTTQDEPSNNRC